MRKKPKREFDIDIEQKWPECDSNPTIKEKIPAGILHGLLLCVWSVGWIGWLCESVGLKPEYINLIGIAVIFGVLLEMMNMMEREGRGLAIGVAFLILIGYLNRESVFSGYNAWMEGFERAVSDYYQINLHLSIGNADIAENIIFYGLVLGMLMLIVNFTTVALETGGIAVVMTGLALIMSLLIDGFPDAKMMLVTLTALGGLVAFDSVNVYTLSLIMNRKAFRAGGLAVIMLALIFGFSYWFAQNYAADYMHSRSASVKEYPQQMMAAVKQLFTEHFGDSNGHLTNQPPVQSDRVMLKLWTDIKPESAVYLKNFSGVAFNTDTEQWAVITDEGLEKAYQSWTSSDEWTYDEAKILWAQQLYTCLSALEDSSSEQSYVISNVAADDQCTWAPYGIDMSGLQMEGDSYIQPSEKNEFKGYALRDSEKLLYDGSGVTVSNQNQADLFKDYERYVYANYLNVPDGMPSLEQAVEEIQSENGDLSMAQWVTQIQNVLWENCSYDKSGLESVADGSNVIEDFFGRQKRGYCIHFASAGVMMLRMAGIPARYVSGYVVWSGDFKKDTSLDGYTADVTGYRGHAWAEVYDRHQGIWIPVDMTPSDSVMAENYPPTTETDAVSTENTETTEQSTTAVDESVTETAETRRETEQQTSQTGNTKQDALGDDNTQENQSASNQKQRFPAWPVVIVIILAAACGFVYHYRQHKNPVRKYSRVNRNKALLSMWQQLTAELDKAGIRPEKALDDWAYIEWLQAKIQKPEADELAYLMEKLHQAAFSEEMLTEEEYAQCVQICGMIKCHIQK